MVGEWSPRPYLTTAIQFRGFKPLAFPGSSDDPEQWELKFPTLTLALVRFYFQFDALIIAGVKCKETENCNSREWHIPYEKRIIKMSHVDLGINIPVGLYGASRGGGPLWIIAGVVIGTAESLVLTSIEHANFMRNRVTPAINLLMQQSPTYICNYGFPNI